MSDPEYVEMVRQQVRAGKRWAILGGALALLSFGAAFWLSQAIILAFKHEALHIAEIAPGMLLGLIAGAIGGLFMFFGVAELGLALNFVRGFRTERLLLKYYDMAKEETR